MISSVNKSNFRIISKLNPVTSDKLEKPVKFEKRDEAHPGIPAVSIIILNYNNWRDTVECLESVFRLNYPNFRVVLVDNASKDDSLAFIQRWIGGNLDAFILPTNPLRHFSFPPVTKPIQFSLLHPRGGKYSQDSLQGRDHLTIICTETNQGYAGGNNAGLQLALENQNPDFLWILNNDLVVEPDSLKRLVDFYTTSKKGKQKIGLVGSKILFYNRPEIIQAAGGGRLNKWLAITRHLGEGERNRQQFDRELPEMAYVMGAAIFAPVAFIQEVGLLCEDYFLYYEELDWAERGKKLGWKLAYCPESVVYHKEGKSIGSSTDPQKRSFTSEYFALKNRITFGKKFYPAYLPAILIGLFFSLANGVRRGQFYRFKIVYQILRDFVK